MRFSLIMPKCPKLVTIQFLKSAAVTMLCCKILRFEISYVCRIRDRVNIYVCAYRERPSRRKLQCAGVCARVTVWPANDLPHGSIAITNQSLPSARSVPSQTAFFAKDFQRRFRVFRVFVYICMILYHRPDFTVPVFYIIISCLCVLLLSFLMSPFVIFHTKFNS